MSKWILTAGTILFLICVEGHVSADPPSTGEQNTWEGGRAQLTGMDGHWPLMHLPYRRPIWDVQLSMEREQGFIWGAPVALHFVGLDIRYASSTHLGAGVTYSWVGIWETDFFTRIFLNRIEYAQRVYILASWEKIDITLGVSTQDYSQSRFGQQGFMLVVVPEAGLEWDLDFAVLRAILGPTWDTEYGIEQYKLMGGATLSGRMP